MFHHHFNRSGIGFPAAEICNRLFAFILASGLTGCLLGMPATVLASMRALYLNPASLCLFEKVGKAENLGDNPARFHKLTGMRIEQSLDTHWNTTKPYDPIFQKDTRDELMDESTQMVYSVPDFITVNLGYRYRHDLHGNDSTSTLDETRIADANKSFLHEINGAIASDIMPGLTAGYAFFREHDENFVELFSDLSAPYAYANDTGRVRHTLGAIWDGFEVFAAYEAQTYQGQYNQIQEADFLTTNLMFNARCILGEVDKENLTLKAAFVNSNFNQRQFEFGRPYYELDFLNNQAALSIYYYHPEGSWDGAVGVEASCADRDKFNADAYNWVNYKTYNARVPIMLGARIFSFLRLWAEVDIDYDYTTYAGDKAFGMRNSFGLQINVPNAELNVYTFPFADVVSLPGTVGERSSFKLGLNAKITY
jgi:hypothetical protein